MDHFNLIHVGHYRTAETHDSGSWTDSHALSFILGGFDYFRCGGVDLKRPGPALFIRLRSEKSYFSAGSERDNWTVLFLSNDIQRGLSENRVDAKFGGVWLSLPRLCPVEKDRISAVLMEIRRLRKAAESPTPRHGAEGLLAMNMLLREFMDSEDKANRLAADFPVERFKARLDGDPDCQTNLEAHASLCGYSVDHLRVLFEKEYGISPGRYRVQRRMARAMNLVASSDLSVKEIAHTVGCHHVSHLVVLFRQHFKMTPGEAIRRYRHGHMHLNGDTPSLPL
jgi:AraC-like DNA-binding protein